MGPRKKLPVGSVFPVNSTFSTVSSVHFGASPWLRKRPVDEQQVRQVCSILHETCTLIVQLCETNIFVDSGSQSRPGSAESRHVWAISAGIAYFSWMWHFPGEIGRPNAPKCRSQKVGILKCKSRADRSKPVGLLVRPPAACSAMAARRFGPP